MSLRSLAADGIVSYFKKQAGPSSVELHDDADFQKFVSDSDASVVGELQSLQCLLS